MDRLRPEIRKLCVVRTFADIEELVGAATELKRVLGELGETPYELLKEEQEEGVAETMMEKQVNALNNTLINFLKGNVPRPVTTSSSSMSARCQICKGRDHIATACPRLNEPWPKCAKCGMPCRNPTLAKCGVKPNTWKSWRLGVLRDSRMFRARQQGAKHLALGFSWCHWKGLET